MRAAEFAKRRARIEHNTARGKVWRERAMFRLVMEARAIGVMNSNRQIVGWQLPGGEIVCVKQRYKSEERAALHLGMIDTTHRGEGVKPVRAYPCPYCSGWHVTSRA